MEDQNSVVFSFCNFFSWLSSLIYVEGILRQFYGLFFFFMKISLTFQKCKGKTITENVFLFSLSSVLQVVCFCHDYSHFFQRRPAVWTLWVGSRERNGRIASSFLKANVGGIQAAQTLDINSDGGENIWSNRLPLVTKIREFISIFPPKCLYLRENFPAPWENIYFPKKDMSAYSVLCLFNCKEVLQVERSPLITKRPISEHPGLLYCPCPLIL